MRSDPSAHVLKIIDTDLPPADQIVSYGQWRIWRTEREEADWKKEEKREWGEGVNARAGDVFVGRILEARRRLMRGRAHCCETNPPSPPPPPPGVGRAFESWFRVFGLVWECLLRVEGMLTMMLTGWVDLVLNILDTHPDHQRRGAGRMIVEWGTKIADEEGLPCYLEGSEAGYRLYRQNGFEDVETLEWELEEWGEEGVCRFVCMIRPAKEK